jgi:hypothetical protein
VVLGAGWEEEWEVEYEEEGKTEWEEVVKAVAEDAVVEKELVEQGIIVIDVETGLII